jgi:hypothetical protein
MKLIPSETLRAHLLEQNVVMREGGFDVPDNVYAEAQAYISTHPIHANESPDELKDRIDYAVIWPLYGVPQNGNTRGADLTAVQKVAALTREINHATVEVLPAIAENIISLGEKMTSEIRDGKQGIESAIADFKEFSAVSHAEAIKLQGDSFADISELLVKCFKRGLWIIGGILGAILVTLIVLTVFSVKAHAQGTAVTANQRDGTKLHVTCDSGCSGAGGSTTPTNAFANPTTAGLTMSFNAMWNGSSWDLVKGDTTNGLWVNVKALPALAAGSAVIGHVIVDTSSTTAVTQATGTNLHAVIDTGSTTAVTQATGTNLHAVIDSGSTTVTQATGTNLHTVIDSGTTAVTNAGTFAVQITNSTDPCGEGVAKQSALLNMSSATTTSLVAVSGSTTVYLCGFNFVAGGTTNATIVYGTGAACTSPVAMTPDYPLIANTGIAYGNGGATIAKTIASQGICAKSSGSVTLAVMVTYVQQ